jgi:hypothetical protein
LVIRDDVGAGWITTLSAVFWAGSWSYSTLVVGGVSDHATEVSLTTDSTVGGSISLYGKSVPQGNFVNALFTVKNGGYLNCDTDVSFTQKVIVEDGAYGFDVIDTELIWGLPYLRLAELPTS